MLALLVISDPTVVIGSGKIGFQFDRLIVVANRLVVLLRFIVGGAAIVVGCGIIGFQSDRLIVFADRFVVILFLIEVPTTAVV